MLPAGIVSLVLCFLRFKTPEIPNAAIMTTVGITKPIATLAPVRRLPDELKDASGAPVLAELPLVAVAIKSDC